jgi:hypothetical protein
MLLHSENILYIDSVPGIAAIRLIFIFCILNVDQAPGTREGQDVKGSKTGQNKTKKATTPPEDKVEEIEIRDNKIIECFQKSGLFDSFKAIGVDTSIQGDKIILSGRDTPSLKMCSEKAKGSLRKVKCKSTDITDLQSHLLSKEDVVVFIDNHLGIKDKAITWEVVLVLDQVKLNVYTMYREKIAADISSKIMACIIEEHISMEESKNEWFDNMLKNESSKLVAGNMKGGSIFIYSTFDVHKKYLTEPRQKTKSPNNQITATATVMSSVPCQSSITNSVDQPSTEKYQAAESTDRPGLTLTGLTATAKQLSDNTLATNSSTTNFNGGNKPTNQLSQSQGTERSSQNTESAPGTQAGESTDQPGLTVTGLDGTTNQPSTNMLATTSNFNGGNQPTNQLSQAQGGNGTSQIAESVPGIQSVLNHPNSITNSVDQPSTEKYRAAESRNQTGLTVTGLAATTNQPNTNMLATTSNFNGGNQPTNQLSQTQGGNGTSQIAESVPGTQSVLNQPNSITNREKYQAAESQNQPGLTVTGLAATTNQPNTNMLATTSNFNGGNQPTNQLSQSQGTERSSQNTESAPGTQTDLNQPEPVTCIPLSYWFLQYFEKFGWHIVDDICQKSQVKCTMEGKRLLLNGNQKSVATVKKEVDGILESLEILQEQTYCGKPFLPEDVKQKWIQIEKDKKCLITTESEKPVLLHGWVINTEDPKMHILYMMGSITLADVDVILCPVTDKLEPIDDAADAIRTGTCFFLLIVILNILLFFSYSRGSHGHFIR